MTFARHLRVTARGDIMNSSAAGTPIEQFAFRLNLSNPTGAADQFTQARCDDYAADTVAFFANAGAKISSFSVLTEVKLAAINELGLYEDEPFITAVSQRGGGGTSLTYPTQVALAVSLETARRGATGKGRIYLPTPTTPISSDATIDPTARDGVTTAVVSYLNALNNVPGFDGVAPRVTIASSKGYNSDVTGVRIGTVLDTIRSRRTSLVEAHQEPVALA